MISANESSDGSTSAAADALVLHAYQRDGVRWLLNKLRTGRERHPRRRDGSGKDGADGGVRRGGEEKCALLDDKRVLVVAPLRGAQLDGRAAQVVPDARASWGVP